MPPRLHKILRFELPLAAAMDIVIQAVQAIPAVIMNVNDQKRNLTAKTQMSMKSHGENIRVQVEALDKDDSQCQVRIDSELMWILIETQLDWGINAHNIEVFEKAMRQGVRQWEKAHKAAPLLSTSAPVGPRRESSSLEQMQCSACGAKLTRQAEAGSWRCDYCGHEYIKKD
jgi:hypothetical protein